MAVVELHVLSDHGVAIDVLGRLQEQAAPGAEVAPSEVGGADEDLLRLLHDGVVDGDVLALRIDLVDDALLVGCAEHGAYAVEDLGYVGLIDAEGIDDGGCAPNEDARVPEEVFLFQVGLRHLALRLLVKLIDAEYLPIAGRGER